MPIMSWKELLIGVMAENNETLDDIVHSTLTKEELNKKFDTRSGGPEGEPFTVWTNDFVYFPGVYDGAEWVAFVHRNPCDVKTEHVGGW